MCNGRHEQVITSTVVFQLLWVPALAASMHIITSVTRLYWVWEGEAEVLTSSLGDYSALKCASH